MSTYDQAVFELLTKPENYRAANDVAARITQINEALRNDFIGKAIKNLNSGVLKQNQWRVDWDGAYMQFRWEGKFRVWYHYGVFNLGISGGSIPQEKVQEIAAKYGLTKKPSPSKWPSIAILEELSLSNPTVLERLLPTRAEETLNYYLKAITDFFNDDRFMQCCNELDSLTE